MTALVFRTPSRNCPARHLNGSTVTVRAISPDRIYVRRMKKRVNRYTVQSADKQAIWIAYPDELHIERSET